LLVTQVIFIFTWRKVRGGDKIITIPWGRSSIGKARSDKCRVHYPKHSQTAAKGLARVGFVATVFKEAFSRILPLILNCCVNR
jgi:hypothetical protein